MELGIEAEREAGTGSIEHDLAAIFFTRPESSSSEVGKNSLNSHVIMASSINGRTGASVIDNVSSSSLIVTILSQKKSTCFTCHTQFKHSETQQLQVANSKQLD